MASKEVLLSDNHGDLRVYNILEDVLSTLDAETVFHCGDVRGDFSRERFFSIQQQLLQMPEFQELNHLENAFARAIQENHNGDQNAFIQAIQQGTMYGEEGFNALQKFKELRPKLDESSFFNEARIEYASQNNLVKDLKNKHNVKWYGVHGNHDTAWLSEAMTEVDWLTDSQSLKNEKVIGGVCSLEHLRDMQRGEGMDSRYGARGEYSFPVDDDYDDYKKSKLYNDFKDTDIDLAVTHSSGDFGKNVEQVQGRPAIEDGRIVLERHCAKGIRELGKKNKGMVNYHGHFHKGLIYNDEVTGVTTLNPGQNHVFYIERDGKEIKWVHIYKIEKLKK